MKSSKLHDEIAIQIDAMTTTINELTALHQDVLGREPTIREKTAASAFLAQFYNGIENILKRISHHHDISLPVGDTWHVELFQRFIPPTYANLPSLLDSELASTLAPYRRFRHVVFHGYGVQLDWERMEHGVVSAANVFGQFKKNLDKYLAPRSPRLGS